MNSQAARQTLAAPGGPNMTGSVATAATWGAELQPTLCKFSAFAAPSVPSSPDLYKANQTGGHVHAPKARCNI
jgi:hypothetical protein